MLIAAAKSALSTRAGSRRLKRLLAAAALLPLLAATAGCNMVVMQPSGDVAMQQRNLVIASTGLMLLIIIPVIALTLLFAWRYRANNTSATYDPDWHHSTQLEVVIWAAPLVIIIALGALTWISTHTLDPYRPLSRIEPGRPVAAETKPLEVQVVALDWKWLFFYPEYGIATVNELAAPVDRPISFKLTAASVMNTFYVPALAGMVYAMPGMEMKLHAVINKPGTYHGQSAHYSGSGFSRMTFNFLGQEPKEFEAWVAKAKAEGKELSRDTYLQLEKPSEREPVQYFNAVADNLYSQILNMCALPGKMCMSEMMKIDARGGGGVHSRENREKLRYDNRHVEQGDEAPGATGPASGRPARSEPEPGTKPSSGHDDKGTPAPAQLNNQ